MTQDGADCLSDLKVTNVDNSQLFILDSCETKTPDSEMFFYFGYITGDQEFPLYGPTPLNYVSLRLPEGSYTLFGAVCDSMLVCSRLIKKNHSVQGEFKNTLKNDSDIKDFLEFETANPQMIPATTYYLAKELKLDSTMLELLLEITNDYMTT